MATPVRGVVDAARSEGRLLVAFCIELDGDTPAALFAAGIYTAGTLESSCAVAA